jgi:arginine/ornithine transport system substrate-binding protein
VQRATIHDNFVTTVYGNELAVKRYGTQDEAYLDMVAGRVDLLLADSVAMDGGFLQTDAGKDYEFVGPDFSDPEYFGEGAGIALRKGEDELRNMFNAAIDAIRANGKYKAIQDKYFDFNVYGS